MEGLPSLMGDPIQLEQVILNLIRNSLEAMEDPAWEKSRAGGANLD